ncbi:hypothetical protein IWX90DRAFT_310788 [Phyllosticta citrichinensis]|uniref:Secreted protein n=1 Tax=Phyllosticta citrichinensis TaxID=1130410 RepID=A0ABR1XM01_9PEZI
MRLFLPKPPVRLLSWRLGGVWRVASRRVGQWRCWCWWWSSGCGSPASRHTKARQTDTQRPRADGDSWRDGQWAHKVAAGLDWRSLQQHGKRAVPRRSDELDLNRMRGARPVELVMCWARCTPHRRTSASDHLASPLSERPLSCRSVVEGDWVSFFPVAWATFLRGSAVGLERGPGLIQVSASTSSRHI